MLETVPNNIMWPFRPPQTPPDVPDRHQTTLDLIEQVATLRGQVRAMETEWDDIRAQIKKGFQRMEKANQRAEKRGEDQLDIEDQISPVTVSRVRPPSGGRFLEKLQQIKKGG